MWNLLSAIANIARGARVRAPHVAVSVALCILSLIAVFVARSLPVQVEQENKLLSYEHQGRFDYLIYLKPSYLFGPPPQASPENPKFPAKLIDTIDFYFRYSPAEWGSEVVKIDADLEDPGIWQKSVRLIPYTSKTGDFTLHFSLDMDEIQELFTEIEEEIEIITSPRHLTINAYVTAPKEDFVQSLPMELTDTLLEVDANLKHTQECGNGEIGYEVNLKENSIFEEKTLKPPPVPETPSSSTTLRPGDVIFSRLADNMDVTFSYEFRCDQPVNKVTTDTEIVASLEAIKENPDDPEVVKKLWSKIFPVLYTKEEGDFNISFSLDLAEHLDLLDTILTETRSSADSYNLTVNANVHSVAETQTQVIDEIFNHSLTGNIDEGIIDWNDELSKVKPGSIKTTTMIPNPNSYMGFSVDETIILSTSLAVFLSLWTLLLVLLYILSRPPAELPEVEREAIQLRKKYGQRMAEAMSETPTEGEKIISLSSVEDLIKVADETGKPIIHQAPGTSEAPHIYYIFDGASRYQYVLAAVEKEQPSDAEEPEYRREVKRLIDEVKRKTIGRDKQSEDEHPQT